MKIIDHYDVAVIGSGIVGLAHAWSAAQRGLRVIVFDRSERPEGASIRNFGMVWPIGQSTGINHEMALISRERWLELSDKAGIWVNPVGSLHLAHHSDEMAVLDEFHSKSTALGYRCELFDSGATLKKSAAVNPKDLRGSLWSPTELCVDPRDAVRQIPTWLEQTYKIKFHFNTLINHVTAPLLTASNGQSWHADKILICAGSDFQSLFPELFAASPMVLCKLQMMATVKQDGQWRMGPHLASGLTLRHYSNFGLCESLAAVQARVEQQNPLFDSYGIHVMASHGSDGSVILGDSHEYGDDIDPFRKSAIDELIINEARRIFDLPDWTLARRWDGTYAKNPDQTHYSAEAQDGVRIITGLGGAGMTLSFGLAERHWNSWLASESAVESGGYA
jgi:D-hydroxyproline dehydrogenase subunit beta